jgi:nucleoside diphosphate kinase
LGATDPKKASAGTIRSDFGAAQEIPFFFSSLDLV